MESGLAEGAKATAGGSRHGDKGYFVKPTVLVNTNEKMKVVREEIFGPVVTAIPFKDVDDLIAKANNSEYGLAAGVWTKDIAKAHRIASKLRAGTVWINCYNVFDAALPFGGYKQSGWGREMGHEVLESLHRSEIGLHAHRLGETRATSPQGLPPFPTHREGRFFFRAPR